ncbi:MAG: coproporphyrinogen dehydrogenase HemZ [Clostridiales bacterium]|nr:coproporphyrinogen dehydrogenase HemZ [Clostridiales bacterium]
MLKLNSDYAIENELIEICGLFFDLETTNAVVECAFLECAPYIMVDGRFYCINLSVNIREKKFSRLCKTELYKVLSAYTGKKFPWGALTGVRPTKLGYEIAAAGGDIVEGLMAYEVDKQKAETIKRIIGNQMGLKRSEKKISLYVHIPFCTSRCNYCSFVSLPTKGNEALMARYTDFLIKEIQSGVETLCEGDYQVDSIYIGGGTPTALSDDLLEAVLASIPYRGIEFTVEAGRPDTITASKLDIMERHGVTRISINPQSFVDKTLGEIGRAHTADDIKRIYRLAKGRFIINMDLIAGLSSEDMDDFSYTIDEVAKLKPENITVHTLARKNGSIIKTKGVSNTHNVSQMVDFAYSKLLDIGYEPYYLYRQKNMLDNLENIGYALPGTMCVNNITTMEEFYSVFACGAGAISKRIFEGNRIERHPNLRDVRLYIEQFDERLAKKVKFFL